MPRNKEEFDYAHDWDAQVAKEQLRAKRQKIALISVLGVALLAMAYLVVVVVFQKNLVDMTGGPAAAGTAGTEETEMDSPPDEGDPEASEKPPDVSPLFPRDLAEADLRKINLGEEINFQILVTRYGNEIQDRGVRDGLRRVAAAIKAGEGLEAYTVADQMSAPAGMRQALRAVALTRLLRKKEAGDAFSLADSSSQPAEFYFEYGAYYLGANDLAGAYRQFATGTRKEPGNAPLHFAAAQAAFELQNWEDVIRHVDAAMEHAVDTPENAVLVAASAQERTGRAAEAVTRCRSYLEQNPAAHRVKLFLARVLGARGQLAESLAIYAELQKDQPESQLVQIERVRAHLANQDFEGAVSLAAQLAGQQEDDPRLQAWFADVLAAAGQSERAGTILQGLSGDLKDNELAVLQSIVAVRESDLATASAALEPFHTGDPQLGIRWATLKFRQGLGGAEVREVLARHQLNSMQWNHLATAAGSQQLWGMAAFCFEEAIAAGDRSHITLNNWAWAMLQDPNGFEVEKVEQACLRALAVSPDNPSVLHTLALALLRSNQPGRCAQLLVEKLDVTKTSPELSLVQGQAYRALQANPSARQAFLRCLELMEPVSEWTLELSRAELEELIASLRE